MKILKYLLTTVFAFFIYSFVSAQDIYINWQKSGSGYWSSFPNYSVWSDFDFCVTKTPINKYYSFDIWLFSQSYYWDGYRIQYTSTNIRNIDVYVDNILYTVDRNPLGITFYQKYNPPSLRITTTNPYPKIYLNWGQMHAK